MFEFTTISEIHLDGGETLILPCTVNYLQVDNDKLALEVFDYLDPMLSNPQCLIGLDIETTGLSHFDSEILSLQLGTSKNEQFIFDTSRVDRDIIRKFLLKPFWKLGHNLKFDAKFINYHYKITLTNFFDTFVAEKLLYLGNQNRTPLSLDAVIQRRLGRELKFVGNDLGSSSFDSEIKVENAKKRMQRSFEGMQPGDQLSPAQLAYASQDVAYDTVFKIAKQQYEELKKCSANIIFNEQVVRQLSTEEERKEYLRVFPPELSLWPTAKLEFDFLEVVIDMELNGISFDLDRHAEVIENLCADHKSLKHEVLKLLSPSSSQKTLLGVAAINLESPEQLLRALYNVGFLGIKSTDAMELENLEMDLKMLAATKNIPQSERDKYIYNGQILTALSKYRKISKLNSAFGTSLTALVNEDTSRLYPNINQMVDTGRISVKNPNIQQIPRKVPWADKEASKNRYGLRECFVAREGYKFVILDYSAQELCIAACVSQDPFMLSAINEDKDLHCYTVSLMEKISYEQVFQKCKVEEDKEWVEKRTGAKVASFASLYGSSAYNLAQQLRITDVDAQVILDKYWQAYPYLAKVMPLFSKKSHKSLYSNTVLGRRRLYSEPYRYIRHIRSLGVAELTEEAKKNYEYLLPITPENIDLVKEKITKSIKRRIDRQAGNHVIQGTAGDMLKKAANNVFQTIRDTKMDARIVALVHDEMVVEVIDSSAEDCKTMVEKCMISAFKEYCPFVKGKVEGHINPHWMK
jgi:DNA polymerase I-like protein with 3'-5' exonuclease and polymerase domains